ncbi:MAG: cytochrome c [Proteobacteria bacterium]|nr:cytochrome c [Pseudomonadota bacterium]
MLRGRGSRMRTGVAGAALVLAMISGTAMAQNAPTGDAVRGKAISYTCLGCHGIDGYKNAYPMYSVPKLEGQHADYLAAALKGYRDGDRSHLTMHSQASTLSDQDIQDIAVYFAGQPLAAPAGAKPGTPPPAAALCTSCHGADGISIAPTYPSLAGQHPDYIVRAIDEYKKGGRKNPIMKQFAGNLSDADAQVIAAYFSKLQPGLKTESRPYTRFGEPAPAAAAAKSP